MGEIGAAISSGYRDRRSLGDRKVKHGDFSGSPLVHSDWPSSKARSRTGPMVHMLGFIERNSHRGGISHRHGTLLASTTSRSKGSVSNSFARSLLERKIAECHSGLDLSSRHDQPVTVDRPGTLVYQDRHGIRFAATAIRESDNRFMRVILIVAEASPTGRP